MSEHDHGHAEHGHDEQEHGHVHDASCGHDHDEGKDGGHSHGHADAKPDASGFDPVAFGGVDISGDGGLYKKLLSEGKGEASPPSGSKVKVHYVGTLMDGSKFDSSRDRPGFFEFDVGVGQVIKGWDEGIMTMKKGEKAILVCRHDYAYGESGSPPKIPPRATLQFEVELFSWKEKRKSKYELDETERMAEAETLKAQGTAAFKQGDFDTAKELYTAAYGYIDEDYVPAVGTSADHKTLIVSCHLNAATCALKLGSPFEAEEEATKAIKIDLANAKAHFRRGNARMLQGDYSAAKADLREASKLDPKSKEVREMFAACQAKENEAKKAEKALAAKMFG